MSELNQKEVNEQMYLFVKRWLDDLPFEEIKKIPVMAIGYCLARLSKQDELLKEQETKNTGKARIFQCEKCGYGIDDIYLSNEHDFDIYPHFCPNCGRTVECLQNR